MSAAATERCPRCGAGFHCGMTDTLPCACSGLPLDAQRLAELRRRFTGCLCLACLREFATRGIEPELGK